MLGWLKRLFHRPRYDIAELARRLDVSQETIARTTVEYRTTSIPKRSGGVRKLAIPTPALKTLQRRLLHRVFAQLRAHPAACGFERDLSIADHASRHARCAVVLKFDIEDFFSSTTAARITSYFQGIGWDETAAAMLTKLCTWQDSLPQGGPTSPRLSNLVNYQLDARLAGLAKKLGANYSRYADDLTFSLPHETGGAAGRIVREVRSIVSQFGYRLNRRKTRVMRRHQRQQVTGLVVNDGVRLPRETRRLLRAVEHRRHRLGRGATLSDSQLAGWRAFRAMVEHP